MSYGGVWFHRLGDCCVPDSSTFEYYDNSFTTWPRQLEKWQAEAIDYWFHFYQPRPGDTIVDIGAGRGEYLAPFCNAVGPAGNVVAVEANPESCHLLRKFSELNRLPQVTVLHFAVSDSPGTVFIDSSNDDWSSNSIHIEGGSRTVEVPAITLDALLDLAQVGRIDFLKMNIEGAERLAIKGLAPIARRIRNLCIACHDFRADRGESEFYRTRAGIIRVLRELDFSVTVRETDPRPEVRDHVHATNQLPLVGS